MNTPDERSAAVAALETRAGVQLPPQPFPRSTLRAVGVQLSDHPPIGYFARVWNGEGWEPQTLLGLLARGLLPSNGGPGNITATAARYVSWPGSDALFSSLPISSDFLGWTFVLVDKERRVTEVTAAPPAGALLAVLEGIQGELSDWLLAPSELLESWTASLVISRWPWPAEGGERAIFPVLPADVLRHFWPTDGRFGKSEVPTHRLLLGWATGWDQGLGQAVARCSRTAKALAEVVPNLQWRVGAHRDLLHTFGRFMELGVVSR